MSAYNANPWNISMTDDFHERFDGYRLHFKIVHGITLTKSEFARFLFESWEKRYLELVEEIEKNTEEFNDLTPGDSTVKLIKGG